MEALLLLEYDAQPFSTRPALLRRVEALALARQGRLRFVARQRIAGGTVREIMAIDLVKTGDASAILARWQADSAFPGGVHTRLLTVEPVRGTEPPEPLFP